MVILRLLLAVVVLGLVLLLLLLMKQPVHRQTGIARDRRVIHIV